MMEQSFSLIPFGHPHIPDLTITGKVARQSTLLTIHYALAGKLEGIFLPSRSNNPTRKEELWKTTCFELFLAQKDLPEYWEFNLSPSGNWNIYRMDAYRRIGFRPEMSIKLLELETKKSINGFLLIADFDLSPVIRLEQTLEAGVSAIVQTNAGSETYWALVHPAPIADFHLRESFILAMEE